jgi:hypothetical protein
MDKKLVIEELEKARANLLEYGASTEQIKAIDYAIKIFEASSDLELLRIEAEHKALVYGEDNEIMYGKLINTLRHVNREDIMKCTFINKLEQVKKEIKYLRLHKAEFLTSDAKVCIDSLAVLEILDKLIEEYESEEK